MLYVGSLDQQRPLYQLVVQGDEIATYHSLHYGNPPGEAEDGVNLDSKGGRITKFSATMGTAEPWTLLIDTDDDLHFDQRLRTGGHDRDAITWAYTPMQKTEGGDLPNQSFDPTPGGAPRGSEGQSKD